MLPLKVSICVVKEAKKCRLSISLGVVPRSLQYKEACLTELTKGWGKRT